MSTPGLDLVARLRVLVDAPVRVGQVPGGVRRVIPITGGRVSGPRVHGDVLALGADWNLRTDSGAEHVSARYLVRTDDGVVLGVTNEGWLLPGPGGLGAVTRPAVEAPEGDYAWLNHAVLSGTLAPVVVDGRLVGVDLEFWQARPGA